MELEDVNCEMSADREGYGGGLGSAAACHNVICEPVPVEAKASPAVSSGTVRPQMKWKNAFGFVYQVRKKLSNQPQVYNDFIDIMRKVHNRSIETAQVVAVISDLFKDHPDLMRGFNAFLPDKHKIDVKLQLRVAVSGTQSPDSPSGDPARREQLPITTRIIRFTLNVRKRFEDDEKRPEKYKRFVQVLYLYKALSQQLQGLRRCRKKLKEEDVYAEVRKLFENNEDLLLEFSDYLPYNKRLSDIYKDSYKYYNDDGPYNCSCCSDVSSSGQVDPGKERIEKLDLNRSHDEVTSSDDPGRFRLDLPSSFGADMPSFGNEPPSPFGPDLAPPFRIHDIKKFDVSSTRITIKRELLDSVDFDDADFPSLARDVLQGPSGPVKNDYILKYFKTEIADETFEEIRRRNSESEKKQINNGLSPAIDRTLENPSKPPENAQIRIKKEKPTDGYDLDDRFVDSLSVENETAIKRTDDAERFRAPRKPLTPFKVPLPPGERAAQDAVFKRSVEEDKACWPVPKRMPALRESSPPPHSIESSVITRLARRVALGSPPQDEDTSFDDSTALETDASPASPPLPAKSSSDRRLRNLRKRLRRLANL